MPSLERSRNTNAFGTWDVEVHDGAELKDVDKVFHRGLYYNRFVNMCICVYKTGLRYWMGLGAVFCTGVALGGSRLVRFHSIGLPLGSIMCLTKTCTACGISTPEKEL